MALFQRRPQAGEAASLYTLGLNKTLLIVGLGNIGSEFAVTRHNIGFDCLDEFAQVNEFPDWVNKKDLNAFVTIHTLSDSRVILAKPTTMMNLSGKAVEALMNFYKLSQQNILLVHDELDIPFGQIRTHVGGSGAGHNGIKSVIESIGEDFGRIRIGVGPKTPDQIDSATFVLQKFSKVEQNQTPALKREVVAVINEWLYSGQALVHESRNFII